MTASVVRAYLENSLFNESPLKNSLYLHICSDAKDLRRADSGNSHSSEPKQSEALIIWLMLKWSSLLDAILKQFGISNTIIKINTIGSFAERETYLIQLKNYLPDIWMNFQKTAEKIRQKIRLGFSIRKIKQIRKFLNKLPNFYEYLNPGTKSFFRMHS